MKNKNQLGVTLKQALDEKRKQAAEAWQSFEQARKACRRRQDRRLGRRPHPRRAALRLRLAKEAGDLEERLMRTLGARKRVEREAAPLAARRARSSAAPSPDCRPRARRAAGRV